MSLSGFKLETTGTTIKVFKTGNMQGVIAKKTANKRVDADETDKQLEHHLATMETEA
jgi:hypothetical protein